VPRLFGRVVEIVVQDQRFTDLRVAFSVTRSLRGQPGQAEVTAYNLAPDLRSRLLSEAQGGVRVSLRAGYRTTGVAQIFLGDVRRVQLRREGAEVAVVLSAGDGLAALSARAAARSFAAGAGLGDVLRRVVEDSGLGAGNALTDGVSALAGRTLGAGGIALDGDVSRSLDAVTRAGGLEWSVQDGQVQVLRAGQPRSDLAVLLSPATGLVGDPSEDEQRVLRATSLLNPEIVPGRILDLRAPDLSGAYRVESVRYVGDTHGAPWYSEVEGRRLGGG
jgi:hypothetical protein